MHGKTSSFVPAKSVDTGVCQRNWENLPVSTPWPALKITKFNDGTENVSTTIRVSEVKELDNAGLQAHSKW